MVHETDVHRFEDDGGPPVDVRRPQLRIGIAPERLETTTPAVTSAIKHESDERVILSGSRAGKTFPEPNVLTMTSGDGPIFLPNGDMADGSQSTYNRPSLILPTSYEPTAKIAWPTYAAWRKMKCSRKDTVTQSTLEFVGEVGELSELLLDNGPAAFYAENRKKLIEECGDIFFCGSWSLDAWGRNPLIESEDDVEMFRPAEDYPLLSFTLVFGSNPLENVLANDRFMRSLKSVIFGMVATMGTQASLLCNAAKKQVFQKHKQDVDLQVGRVCNVLVIVNQLLIMANSNVEEALTVNQTKLNHRYSGGCKPGGGDRTGAGK